MCWYGYGLGVLAPGIQDPGVAAFKAGHTLLKSHAKAYHTYRLEFKTRQRGKLVTLSVSKLVCTQSRISRMAQRVLPLRILLETMASSSQSFNVRKL